jgi:hypothetical protein
MELQCFESEVKSVESILGLNQDMASRKACFCCVLLVVLLAAKDLSSACYKWKVTPAI